MVFEDVCVPDQHCQQQLQVSTITNHHADHDGGSKQAAGTVSETPIINNDGQCPATKIQVPTGGDAAAAAAAVHNPLLPPGTDGLPTFTAMYNTRKTCTQDIATGSTQVSCKVAMP